MYPGGVSTLILNTIFLLVEKGYIKDEIQFVLGSEEKSEWFFDALKKGLKNDILIELDIIGEIFYWDDSMGKVEDAAEKVKEQFKAIGAGGKVLWAQNPTLGKNAAYTLALKKLAREVPDQKIWMHVHDSAEQGRWPNLDHMYSSLSEPYYFDSPGTRWMVINKIDYRAYLESGMPSDHLFYVPDPLLISSHVPQKSKQEIGEVLKGYAEKNNYTFEPDRPWLLFAGRTIRRKNLLETFLVALCARKELTFTITLPADSPDDKPYEDMVFNAIRKYKLGAAGFGIDHVGKDFALRDLAAASDLIISCSVMEGFGLPYLEFPMFGRPVYAKNIYIMEDFVEILHDLPHHYYGSLKVPVDRSTRETHLKRYLEKVNLLAGHFKLAEEHRSKVEKFFQDLFVEENVDFSFLSASAQLKFVENLDMDIIKKIQSLNEPVFDALETGFKDQARDPQKVSKAIDSAFGADVYATNVKKMMASYEGDSTACFDAERFMSKFLGFYFTPENLRLLLDYQPFQVKGKRSGVPLTPTSSAERDAITCRN